MTISTKIHQLREEYLKKHEKEPELLFVNFHTWEEMLKAPQSINGVPNEIAGCEVIPANEMDLEILYCDHDDLSKALTEFDGSNHPVFIKKLTATNRPEAPNARRLIADLSFQNFEIPFEAIKAYQRHEEHKKLKF
ncbi:hypothetical protein [Acinetobacter nosocomialis]|uniref:hypothetical protein n=1 Tax=Acinetobacter nosocomialis TaxID=106654 RepID=UPI0012506D98|nr:hypothetical protein [Acinetobacter nosocomialis]HCA5286185.1 hypothetical protein [Acinetobacter nosocomialis]